MTIESFLAKGVKPEDLTHLQYADIYDGPVIYKSGGYTGWGIYEVPTSFSAITSSTYGSNVIRNTGTGEYSLKLEFTFGDKQDNIVEPGETVTITAEFSRSLLSTPTRVEYVVSEATTTTPTGAFISKIQGSSGTPIRGHLIPFGYFTCF